MKKPSNRSQRGNKGIKGKHVLQICVLLGVCIWLIYQVKYSHDKKKEFYETDGKESTLLSEREDGLVKLGRKDLLPGYHNQNENEKHVEEDEDEEEKESKSKVDNGTHEDEEKEEEDEVAEEDEDKNKLGEEVVEEDEEENKHEEDEIDEQDQSKTAGDNDKDDELLDEETESGSNESDEKEKETNHADEVDEAREEHYKADDASSAVSHESRMLNTEKLKESSGNSTGTAQENNSNATISEVEVQKEPVLKLGEAESGVSVEKTTTEVKDGGINPETKSAVTELTGETVHVNSTEAILEASGFLQNETEIMRERSQDHDKTEDGAPPSGSSDQQSVVEVKQTRNEYDPNIIVSANITNKDSIEDESRNSTSESSLIENISGSNTTEMKENSSSEGDDETGENESSNLSTEQTDEADDTSESTILQEEREALTDPQTLPDIRIEGSEEDEEEAMAAE